MPRGRKLKLKRNVSGLRNQKPVVAGVLKDSNVLLNEVDERPVVIDQRDERTIDEDPDCDPEWDPMLRHDSLKPDWERVNQEEDGLVGENEEDLVWVNEGWDSRDAAEHGEGCQVKLLNLLISNGDDPRDEDWIPPNVRRRYLKNLKRRRSRPKTYQIGPDISRKAERTKRRYRESDAKQRRLNEFFTHPVRCHVSSRSNSDHVSSQSSDDSIYALDAESILSALLGNLNEYPSKSDGSGLNLTSEEEDVQIRQESLTPPPFTSTYSTSNPDPTIVASVDDVGVNIRAESVMTTARDGGDRPDQVEFAASGLDPWEEEIDENLSNRPTKDIVNIRPWSELRSQIKGDLKRRSPLRLSEINQLLIIQNFATLRLKGNGKMEASMKIAEQWKEGTGSQAHFSRRVRALARHYQIYEQLPLEKRGGSKNAHSLLNDESVRNAARGWLSEQADGAVSPRKFTHALNETILPALGITTQRPLSERTGRRWLIKLGWVRTVYRKGIYMDGHERQDVVNYRDNIFLPRMLDYERKMAKFEGPNLVKIEPSLCEGEREIIPVWQDETCFQQNDFVSSLWLRSGEHILRKKGRGHLIHVSDFIEPTNGRLVVKNDCGEIIQEARKIIYPGSNGDPYWDGPQLLRQVETQAIPTFEAAHPGCQGLFVFDCSSADSAHGAMPEDAIKPFDMNKRNGGKQRYQRKTVIPESNPDPHFRGQVQEMVVKETGEQKGLEQTLIERGFDVRGMKAKCAPVCPFENTGCCMARLLSKQDDIANQVSSLESLIVKAGHLCIFLPKFHCELNPIEMYWGWVKYRYRQALKPKFDDAKKEAVKALNECPDDVIRKFINRSWRFISAYRAGLKGKAAAWAVHKYKGHRTISRGALMHIEALAPPT